MVPALRKLRYGNTYYWFLVFINPYIDWSSNICDADDEKNNNDGDIAFCSSSDVLIPTTSWQKTIYCGRRKTRNLEFGKTRKDSEKVGKTWKTSENLELGTLNELYRLQTPWIIREVDFMIFYKYFDFVAFIWRLPKDGAVSGDVFAAVT